MYRLKKIITTFLLSIFLLNNIGVLNTIYAEDMISLEDIGFYGELDGIKTNKPLNMKLFFTYSLADEEGEVLAQKDVLIDEYGDTIYLEFDVPENFSENEKIKDYSIKISDVSYVILPTYDHYSDDYRKDGNYYPNYSYDEYLKEKQSKKVNGEVILEDLIIIDNDSFFYKKDLKDFLDNNSLYFNYEYEYFYEKLNPTIEWEISQIYDDGTSNIIHTGTGQEDFSNFYDSEIDNGNYDDEHNYITKFRYYDNYDNTLREGSFFKLNNSYPQDPDGRNDNIYLPKEIKEVKGDYTYTLALSEGKKLIDIYDSYGDLIEKSYESVDFFDKEWNFYPDLYEKACSTIIDLDNYEEIAISYVNSLYNFDKDIGNENWDIFFEKFSCEENFSSYIYEREVLGEEREDKVNIVNDFDDFTRNHEEALTYGISDWGLKNLGSPPYVNYDDYVYSDYKEEIKEEIFDFLKSECENENGCYTTINDDYEDFMIFGARIKNPQGEGKDINSVIYPGLSQVKTKDSDEENENGESMFSITHGNIENELEMDDLLFQRKINYKVTSEEYICNKYPECGSGYSLDTIRISLEITHKKNDTEIFACSIEIEDTYTLDLIKQFGHLNEFCKKVSLGERFDTPGNDIYLYGFGEKRKQKIGFKVHSNFEFVGH